MTLAIVQGPTVVRAAAGATLERVLSTAHPFLHDGLTRPAFTTADTALRKTAWAPGHRRRFALVDGVKVLASAIQYDLSGMLDEQTLRICGIGAVCSGPGDGSADHARALVEQLVDDGRRNGADLAMVFAAPGSTLPAFDGFEVMPTHDVELTVAESPRHGAPMTLVRGGEERDLAAIVAMGAARAARCRFHLTRDIDFVKYAMTGKRLLAGLLSSGARQLLFAIAEEGITAAAYVVISTSNGSWTIEECGDRDPSGARVGAILQALIARDPAERRPVIRGWLPPGFVPPQVTVVSRRPSSEVLSLRSLSATANRLGLCDDDVLYWRGDCL